MAASINSLSSLMASSRIFLTNRFLSKSNDVAISLLTRSLLNRYRFSS